MKKKKALLLVLACAGLTLITSCGPTDEEIQLIVEKEAQKIVNSALSSIPAPLPTATPGLTEGQVLIIAKNAAVDTFINLDILRPTPTTIIFPTPLPTATPGLTEGKVLRIAEDAAIDTFISLDTLKPTPTTVIFPTPLPTATPGVNFNEIWLRTYPAVFWIEAGSNRGSGWLLEPGYVVTNQHVVNSYSLVTIRQSKFPPLTGTVVATDQIRDIALIQYSHKGDSLDPRAKPFELGNISNKDSASPLMALGYSGDLGVKSDGAVGSAPANIGSMAVAIGVSGAIELVMDAPVDPGDSGGPVLDSSGKLVGMVRAGFGTGEGRHIGTNYSVHVDTIREVVPSLKTGLSR